VFWRLFIPQGNLYIYILCVLIMDGNNKNDFVPAQDFIKSFSRGEVASMMEHGQLVMRRCDVCNEPQFALPEAVRAWDDQIAFECICQRCYWRLKDE